MTRSDGIMFIAWVSVPKLAIEMKDGKVIVSLDSKDLLYL